MTWEELSRETYRAARLLLAHDRFRGAVNRSYYAAYAAVTSRLAARGVQFGYGGNNPTHEQLPQLILHNLDVAVHQRRRLAAAIRRLRLGRVEADYVPAAFLDEHTARDLVRDAGSVLEILEISDDEG